jgi:tRNA threonylcarbamoyladenosine biosynthesis protein TsaE
MAADACVLSRSARETRQLGERLGRLLEGGDVVGLSGELGAGKTCLAQGLALGLGVPPDVPVTSPTFTLVGQYPGRVEMRHADFYRVDHYARLEDAGFADLLDRAGVLVVEWPERFAASLPRERIEVAIEIVSEEERCIRLRGVGERAAGIVGRLRAQWP